MGPVELVGRDGQLQVGEAVEQAAEGEAAFEAGQRRAQAEVDAVAEAQVAGVVPGQVQPVGLVEARLVAVGGGQVDDDLGAGRDGGVADLDRLGRPAEGRVGTGAS